MSRAIRNFSLFLAALLATLGLVNYLIDPTNAFHPDFERSMAAAQAAGETVYYKTNYDERLFQELYIQQVDPAPETVVLGSSRSMLLGRDITGYDSFYNHSVSGAALEDYIALLGFYMEKGQLPQRVILELSPWNFNDANTEARWQAYASMYEKSYAVMQGGVAGRSGPDLSWTDLFSVALFQDSLTTLRTNGLAALEKAQPYTSLPDDTYYTRYGDGSIRYGREYREQPDEQILQTIQDSIGGVIYGSLVGLDQVGNSKKAQFETLAAWLQDQGIEVIVYLSPLPPTIYDYCVTDAYPALAQVEAYLRDQADVYGYTVRGSYDPSPMGLTDTDFYDCLHAKIESIDRIWNYTA